MAHGFLEVLEAGNSRNKTVIIQDYRKKKKTSRILHGIFTELGQYPRQDHLLTCEANLRWKETQFS